MQCFAMSAVRDNELFEDEGNEEGQGIYTIATDAQLEMTSNTDAMSNSTS